MKLKAIIVDDERIAILNLQSQIKKYCPHVEVVDTASNADEALQLIESRELDLLFLDIQMPGKDGFELLEEIKHKQLIIIFVTAFNQYGIRAIKASALDYLLKPTDPDELITATNRALEFKKKQSENKGFHQGYQAALKQLPSNWQNEKWPLQITVQSNGLLKVIDVASILYIQAADNYSVISIHNEKNLMVSKTLKSFEELLSPKAFFRVHKSFIIRLDEVEVFLRKDDKVQLKDGSFIPVAKRRTTSFVNALKR